ncbi:MAG TPA: hypothetical protein VNK91_05765 [Burkholderiaceae bacterium]|nr:hypothetical protein [Burkholderiaceae bacterium]
MRRVLHLVEDHARRQVGDEPDRVRGSDSAGGLVVEAQVSVPAAPADMLRGRRLAALPRAVDQHRRRIREGLAEPGSGKAGVERRLRHRLIVTLTFG